MAQHLRDCFHDELGRVSERELRTLIDQALASATRFGLVSYRDCCRFLNVAVMLGWDFLARPETAWTVRVLTDARITSASARMERLVEETRTRAETARHNETLRQAFQPPPATPWRDLPDDTDAAVWDGEVLLHDRGAAI
jgi:hypothetical protein